MLPMLPLLTAPVGVANGGIRFYIPGDCHGHKRPGKQGRSQNTAIHHIPQTGLVVILLGIEHMVGIEHGQL